MKDKKVLIGITGSIAVYKVVSLVRLLIKEGATVKVIMTTAATTFVSPLTFSTISKHKVYVDLVDDNNWTNHVELGRWADVMLIAPLSANTLSKMAIGLCDNLLLAVYLSATCPVIVAPAMDEDMWKHPTTKKNIASLQEFGNKVIAVNEGELASGLFGPGRMAEPEEILKELQTFLNDNQTVTGKRVLITAGPTYEPIDPVRFIGNRSSGKMGIAIAEAFVKKGADVTLVVGPSSIKPSESIKTIRVNTAAEMYEACTKRWLESEIGVMCAAVADYAPKEISTHKMKKSGSTLSVDLVKTKDILMELGKSKKRNQFLVGFALETNNEKANALKKLREKNADLIILNSLNDEGAGFGLNTNKITIFDKNGGEHAFVKKTKENVAADIVNTIIDFTNA